MYRQEQASQQKQLKLYEHNPKKVLELELKLITSAVSKIELLFSSANPSIANKD